ncbi:LOW QUALITY PROTEIN: hypothetical protein RJ639_014924, partial [Escallonia herrerae]
MDATEATLFANVITIMLNYDCLSVRWWETNILNSYEVAALIVADDFYNPRDIVVDNVSEGLKQISPLHPSFMSNCLYYRISKNGPSPCTQLDMDHRKQQMSLYHISEILDKYEDPIGYETVVKFIMHGLCGGANTNNLYMKDGKCMKNFPKDFFLEKLIITGFQYTRDMTVEGRWKQSTGQWII